MRTKKRLSRNRLALVGGLFAGTMVLQADTVLWYHFDEEPAGTRTTESSRILNAVDREKLPGIPENYWDENKGACPENMPVYSDAFPTGRRWVDPHTGEKGALNRSLQIVNPAQYGEWGNEKQGVVKIEDDESLHLQTFTIEMFVKDLYLENPDETSVEKRPSEHYVLYKKNSWALSIPGGTGNGSAALQYSVSYGGGGVSSFTSPANGNVLPSILRDNRWHHLALVVDGRDPSAVKVDVYMDYVLLQTSSSAYGGATMPGSVFYDDSPIFIGRKDGAREFGWNGLIDELRISNEALSPEEFLHFAHDNADADTVSYFSFDDWFGNPFKKSPAGDYRCLSFVNETPRKNPVAGIMTLRSTPARTTEGVGPLRGSLLAAGTPEDLGSLQPSASGQTQGFAQTFDRDNGFMCDDFTIEGFLRLKSLPAGLQYVFRGAYEKEKEKTFYLFVTSEGRLEYGFNWTKSVSSPTPVLADFQWHHWAVVSRKSAGTTALYCDGVLCGTLTGADVTVDASDAESAQLMWFSYYADGNDTLSLKDCLIGDVRVTARALDPQEFLTDKAYVASSLAAMRFENDFSVGPYGSPVPAGTPVDSAAAFTKRVACAPVVSRRGETISAENKASLRLNGDTVDFGRNLAVEKARELTVEFLLRPRGIPSGGAEVMRLASGETTVWALTLSEDRRTFTVTAGADAVCTFAVSPVFIGWSEFAFAFAKAGADTSVTCYQNGVPVGTQTIAGGMPGVTAETSRLTVGSAGFKADIDEVRILPGAVDPLDLIDCPRPRGSMVILR